jgi:hypothetical protein
VTAAFYANILSINLSVGDGYSPFYTFDTDPTWTLNSASAKLEALGLDGRTAYRRLNSVDSLFPIFGYGPLLTLAIITVFPNRAELTILPILSASLDVAENFVVLNLLDTREPHFKTFQSEFCDRNLWGVGHFATPLKFLFLLSSVGVLFYGLVISHRRTKKRD